MSNKYLEVTNLKKSFGGIKAVDVQSLNLNRNELTSIIGPNGAGKTTFFDLISGFQDSDEGKVYLVKVLGTKYIEFYGSSSEVANKKHYGGLADYRSSEGRKVRVKYRGKINDTVLNILGGVRSSCTYVGAPSLKQLSKCTTFVRVTKQFNDTFVK